MSVYEASHLYQKFNHDLIILAGKNYGSGPSIGWATKGPYLLGVRAIIAESFNFMHSSNLLAMGIIPLQYKPDQNSEILGLTGREKYSIDLSRLESELNSFNQKNPNLNERNLVDVRTDTGIEFKVVPRIDSDFEQDYFRNSGMMNYVLRKYKDY
jgi:aconitate hydratase